VMMTTSPRIFRPEEQAPYDRVEDAVKLARYGTDCYAYCMIASGQIDLVVEAGLNAYDVAALIPIVRDAGGLVTDWQGNPVDLLNIGNGQILAAGSAAVHAEAMELLNG
jgi:fructose-1,6-bisphosphatase/inositol monophosphatase family enzyme